MTTRLLPFLIFFSVLALCQPSIVLAQEDDETSSEYDDTDSGLDEDIDEEPEEEAELFTFEEVVSNPAKFGLYSKAQFDKNFTAGRNAGRKVGQQDVIKNPAAYGLLSKADVPVVRLSARQGTAFTISMPGNWTRYAQSGMPKIKGWAFNEKTGLLSGVVPSRGNASIRLTPIRVRNQAGAQITLDLRPAAR